MQDLLQIPAMYFIWANAASPMPKTGRISVLEKSMLSNESTNYDPSFVRLLLCRPTTLPLSTG